jgi:hypothetical protein
MSDREASWSPSSTQEHNDDRQATWVVLVFLPTRANWSNKGVERVFAKFSTECQKLCWSPVWGHCTRVFIGTRGAAGPCQRRLYPRVPGLSPEYSHKGRLQTVIKVNHITDTTLLRQWRRGRPIDIMRGLRLRHQSEGGHTGFRPGRALGLFLRVVDAAFIRVMRRRRRKAKGSVFAFAPTRCST